MKISSLLITALAITFFGSCSSYENTTSLEDCEHITSAKKILTQEEKASICIYTDVFRYKDNIYTVCECCICDKVASAYDCDGNSLCDSDGGCMSDFFQKAEYLYSIE